METSFPKQEFPMRGIGAFALAIALSTAYVAPLQAQVMGGPRLGVSISNLSGDGVADRDSRTGLLVGWAFEFQRGERWALHPEFHYWEKGGSSTLRGVTGERNLSYLEVPVLLRVDLSQGSNVTPRILVGPSVGINLTCREALGNGTASVERDCEDGNTTPIKALDLGATGGLGVALETAGGLTFVADGRYTVGLVDIIEGANVRNRGFALVLGLNFPLTR